MRLYLLNSRTGGGPITAFHSYMFNGICTHDYFTSSPQPDTLAELHACCLASYTEQLSHLDKPLQLICNGWRTPDIFWPSTHFIVSSQVKSALTPSVGKLTFRAVKFAKLIGLPYHKNDSSFYDNPTNPYKSPFKLYHLLPDVPELHRRIGDFFELIAPDPSEVSMHYSDLRPAHLSIPFGPYRGDNTLMLSETLLSDYPVLDLFYRILSETAFSIMSPYFDWDYFECVEIEC